MKVSEELGSNVRKELVQTLKLLASAEEQKAYPISAEWFCIWFDDQYHPNSPVHKRAFSQAECDALDHFKTFFEAVCNEIGDPPSTPEQLHAMPVWRDLMDKAKEALQKLGEA